MKDLFTEADFANMHNCYCKDIVAKANRLLSEKTNEFRFRYVKNAQGFEVMTSDGAPTHTMRILNIEPLEVDSERKVLEDAVCFLLALPYPPQALVDRAKALLAKKGEL